MVSKLIGQVDLQMMLLNVTSLGSVLAWVTEYASGFAGGFVLFTIGVLNLAKAYSTIREFKKDNDE